MSTTSRLISGSAASWAQIVVTMASQIALVPIYLSHWNIVMYGTWLAVQALSGMVATLDFGHQEYLGFEFLRIGQNNKRELSKYVWSGVSIGIVISFIQILLVIILFATGLLPSLLTKADTVNQNLMRDAGLVLILQGFGYLFCASVTGLLFRALAPFGYYPRMAWWTLGGSVVTSLVPLITVVLGAEILVTGAVSVAASLVYSVPMYVDLYRLLKKEKIPFCKPSLKIGWQNFLHSLAISGKWFLENARQQGVRLVLAPLAGAVGLTAFSTMRTGSNVALQGLNTVVYPLMPELMRFMHQRDQPKMESAFGTVWFVLVAALAPAMVVIQAFIEPLYLLWTRGRVTFNPTLFAMLSVSVLIYAVAQPAIAVVKGNNLLKPQLLMSIVAAVIVVGGIYILVPKAGLVGSGMALVIAEISAAMGYQFYARRWLNKNGLVWPRNHFFIATTSIFIASLSMGALIILPQSKWIVLGFSLIALGGNLWRYWNVLPELATQHASDIVKRLPGVSKLYAFSK